MGCAPSPEPKKNKPFSERFETLRVLFDLARQSDGRVGVGNTDARLTELREALTALLDEGAVTPEAAARLRGRLLLAEQNFYGRCARQAVVALGDVHGEPGAAVPLEPHQVRAASSSRTPSA